MSRLIMVRHAQASFDKADYDQLSDLGHKQARLLGDWLAETADVKQVYCGPLKRHKQTMDRVYEELNLLGIHWPEPTYVEGLAEHRGPSVLKALLPQLLETDPQIKAWGSELQSPNGKSRKIHLKIFDYAMRKWARGSLDDEHLGFPSWKEFTGMVEDTMEKIIQDANSGGAVVAFTSGGTMSAAVGYALGIPNPETVIGLNGLVYNTGISEFLFSADRLSLKAFNAIPHLTRKELLTYV